MGRRQGTRCAVIAKDYRVLLNIGDNFRRLRRSRYRTSEADRVKAFGLGPSLIETTMADDPQPHLWLVRQRDLRPRFQ